jgi:hypothetical protein
MKKNWMWMLLLPIAANPLLALAAGTLTYGPVGTGGAAHAIPIPSLLLLPLGIILAIVGLRQLSRNRAQQILGLLLTVGGYRNRGIQRRIHSRNNGKPCNDRIVRATGRQRSSANRATGLSQHQWYYAGNTLC